MQLYQYHDLTPPATLRAAFDRVTGYLRAGDFRAADVKKMVDTPYYRARLNDADRLLFRFARYEGQTCLLLLELILHHAYDKSKFLRGVAAAEPATAPELLHAGQVPEADVQPLAFTPAPDAAGSPRFRWLDRPLFFDADQQAVFELPAPLILVGSAGSGKTALILEKLKTLTGAAQAPARVLYVTRSAYLVDNAARLYAAHPPADEGQEVDFLSMAELVNSILVPAGQEVTAPRFARWFALHRPYAAVKDADRLFEEFHGVLTGADPTRPYLAPADYEALGLRQSVFPPAERPAVYALFRKYLDFLAAEGLFNPNLAAFERLAEAPARYDFVVVDEVQDLTNVQLALILRTLRPGAAGGGGFILCGDAHQVVHPNFFSWAGLKALFFQHAPGAAPHALHLLRTNYRNSPAVTALANRLLHVKNQRFGSLDRESTYLVEAAARRPGEVVFLQETDEAQRQLNARSRQSARFAVVVLREEDKAEARRFFDTPLLFSVQEAKGLEYDNVVLVNLISRQDHLFRDVAEGLTPADLTGELRYHRPARADRGGEAYKFVVNALYVAVTRAVHNLYVVERLAHHPLLPLLGLTQAAQEVTLPVQASTTDEWRHEASRLEQQGRTEQAATIREQLLGQQVPDWPVLTPATMLDLRAEALDPARYNRKAKDRFFEYGLLYHDNLTLGELAALQGAQRYNPARQNPEVERRHVLRKYYPAYVHDQPRDLAAYVARYGPDVRDTFGFTPLTMAAATNARHTISWLCAHGANPALPDAIGRLPWYLVLEQFARRPAELAPWLGTYHALLAPGTTTVRYLNFAIKLRADQPETLLFHYLVFGQMALLRRKYPTTYEPGRDDFIEAADVEAFFAALPDSVVPPHRKTRRAINALLARHEARRPYTVSRKLWVRIKTGHYLLNPMLLIEDSVGKWHTIDIQTQVQLFTPALRQRTVDRAVLLHYRAAREEHIASIAARRDELKRLEDEQAAAEAAAAEAEAPAPAPDGG